MTYHRNVICKAYCRGCGWIRNARTRTSSPKNNCLASVCQWCPASDNKPCLVQCSTLCSAAGVVIVEHILGRHLALTRLMVWRFFSFLNIIDARRSDSLYRILLNKRKQTKTHSLHIKILSMYLNFLGKILCRLKS